MKRSNLIDNIFKSKGAYESAIICTYGLNLHFLEEYLMKLDALYTCEDICIFTDSSTYDNFLITDYHPRWLNKKYLVNRIDAKGFFHSKLYMLASDKKANIGIGSSNLTRDGMSTNLELLSCFEVSDKKQQHVPLLFECIKYIQRISEMTKSPTAKRQVDSFVQMCAQFINQQENAYPGFVHNLDSSILDIVKNQLPSNSIEKVQIISPFFDRKISPLFELRSIFSECNFEIYLQQGRTDFPTMMYDQISKFTKVFLYQDITRYIHGKAIIFHYPDKAFLLKGSPNFTTSGLLNTAYESNFEIALFGEISKELATEIVMLNKSELIEATSGNDISVENKIEIEFDDMGKQTISYIIEAIKEKDKITISTDPDITEKDFKPELIHLKGMDNKTHTNEISDKLEITLTPQMKKAVPGIIAVQLSGHNNKGKQIISNIAWVVELEERNSDPNVRRIRRVYNDPSELAQVLQEILESEGDVALKEFLYRFDVSIDLVLPPRRFGGKGIIVSKGNIMGELPEHLRNSLFGGDMHEIFRNVMSRLYGKLGAHCQTPQANKIDNFILIYSALFSVINFINKFAYSQACKESTITPERWSEIRDYYDMVFYYLRSSWELLWGKRGYRDLISTKLKEEENSEDASFEKYVFEYDPDYLHNWYEVAREAKNNIDILKARLMVRTVTGNVVKPKLFPKNVNIQNRKVITAAFAKANRNVHQVS